MNHEQMVYYVFIYYIYNSRHYSLELILIYRGQTIELQRTFFKVCMCVYHDNYLCLNLRI